MGSPSNRPAGLPAKQLFEYLLSSSQASPPNSAGDQSFPIRLHLIDLAESLGRPRLAIESARAPAERKNIIMIILAGPNTSTHARPPLPVEARLWPNAITNKPPRIRAATRSLLALLALLALSLPRSIDRWMADLGARPDAGRAGKVPLAPRALAPRRAAREANNLARYAN